jgi:hypothetical protein
MYFMVGPYVPDQVNVFRGELLTASLLVVEGHTCLVVVIKFVHRGSPRVDPILYSFSLEIMIRSNKDKRPLK